MRYDRGDLFRRFCFGLGLALVLIGCEGEAPERAPIIRPVRTQRVYATGGSRVRVFAGTAQAALASRLSFKVGGTVDQLEVDVGDQVKAGDLIARLDPEDYRLQVQETQASLRRAEAEKRNAEANYARVRALYENRNASRNELDAARAGAESSRAQVVSIEKRLELARSQLRHTRLNASTDGAIAEVRVEVNENVQPGQPVVLLTAGTRLEVKVAVPEILISQVEEGAEVMVTFDALPGRNFPGVVTEVGVVTGMSTTYPVIVRLQAEDPGIRPGMAAEVAFRFESPYTREHYVIPSVAVGEDRQGRFVYVVEPGEESLATVRRRPVRVGQLWEEGIEVLEGVSEGDLVVIAGVSRIVDGQTVKLLPSSEQTP